MILGVQPFKIIRQPIKRRLHGIRSPYDANRLIKHHHYTVNDLDEQGKTPIQVAVENENVGVAKALKANGAVECPAEMAASLDKVETFEKLIESSSSHIHDIGTFLETAAFWNAYSVASYIIYDLHYNDVRSQALHSALYGSQWDMAVWLAESKDRAPYVDVVDRDDCTPLQKVLYAIDPDEEMKLFMLGRVLLERGADTSKVNFDSNRCQWHAQKIRRYAKMKSESITLGLR